jgi:hypothetical protein
MLKEKTELLQSNNLFDFCEKSKLDKGLKLFRIINTNLKIFLVLYHAIILPLDANSLSLVSYMEMIPNNFILFELFKNSKN